MPPRHFSPSVDGYAITHSAGVEIAGHSHDRGQLSVVVKGTMMITAEEGWWLAPPGLAIWVPPGISHSAHYSESSSLLHLKFDSAFAARLPAHCGSLVVTDLLNALARETVRLSPIEAQSDTLHLLARLMVIQTQEPRQGAGLFIPHGRDRRLRQAIELLRQNPGKDIHFDELAAHACTSSRTLARLFVTETGMPFGRWREHLRVVCAVNCLARGLSITHTALELGYASTSSFTTLFTRLLGLPPRRYMQQLRSASQSVPPQSDTPSR
jgi:AraC-like DNA-binding protein